MMPVAYFADFPMILRVRRTGAEERLAWRATLDWLNRCRKLAKDCKTLNRKALAFLRLASIRLMLRKLCNPP